jgi:hypothetical protein
VSIDQLANQDFEKAHSKGVWRRMINRLIGKTDELLPFDEVKSRLPIKGQHYIGLKEVPMENIVGSFGRYQDFDRAFLPLQKRTKDRWISIDKAHHFQTPLPPIELYKLGDIYFVKDGNHRVSVAREQGQLEVDAYVTEIEIPIDLPIDTKIDDLSLKEEYARFLTTSRLKELRPNANIEVTVSGLYDQLLLHIDVHRWFICDEVGSEVPYEDAVVSWYDHIYTPIIDVIRETVLMDEFPGYTEADIALLIIDYLSYIQILDIDSIEQDELGLKASAGKSLVRNYPIPGVRKLVNVLNRTNWLDNVILNQERKIFTNETHILNLRPEANIETTIPGQYNDLREHIAVHRWYLGEHSKGEIHEEQAVTSWFDNVYSPIVKIIREQEILKEFPNRTETDLYLWIIEHQYYLREMWGDEVTLETAAEKFSDDFSERPLKRLSKVFKMRSDDE